MKASWLAVPYLGILAYVIFICVSADKCATGMDEFYDIPYHVTREVREIRARLQTLRNTLPIAFSSPQISFQQIENMLNRHNQLQDESINVIRQRFPDDPDGLIAKLDQYKDELRVARLRVAKEMEGNADLDYATAHYTTEILPSLERLGNVLNQIGAAADARGDAIRADFTRRHFISKVVAICLCLFVFSILLYTEIRDREKRRALVQRERMFNLFSDNVDDVFVASDPDHPVAFASANSSRVLNLPARQMINDPDKLFRRLGNGPGEWLRARLSDRNASQMSEMQTDEKDGRKFILRVYPVNEDGVYGRHITVISDQTDAIAKQRALTDALESSRQANSAKSKFLAHMSHEIRTPMNAIIGMTTIALSKKTDSARVEDCLVKIAQSSRHLLGLINDVLDMSKIEGGKLAIAREEFSLRTSIENIVNIIHPQTEERRQHFEVNATGVESDVLYGDPLRLNQVLINLLSNATKFTPPEGSIHFTIEQMEHSKGHTRLRFIIRDTGIGMSTEFQQHLYQPFEQATPGVAAKFGGSGLGLAITHNLISLMSGVITVKSAQGEGTEFRVEIPFDTPDEESQPVLQKLDPRRILVVDDDPGALDRAAELLESMGMEVITASSGQEALEIIKKAHAEGKSFDACFLDWQMPGMDGGETAHEIRTEFGDETMIIIISAYDWATIEDRAKKAGASGFIAKPFFPQRLYDTLLSLGNLEKNENAASSMDQPDFSGKRVLLVEDNEFNREISNEFLEMVNLEVDNAVNGQEAVDMFMNSQPGYYNLILMDIQMPVMNGYQATHAIRCQARPDSSTVPILAMTANAFNEDIARAMESGMNGHIAKPINVADLYAKIGHYLKPPKPPAKAA